MSYKSLEEACIDLQNNKLLIRIQDELDPDLIIPEIHRRVYSVGGPALFFENIKNSPFPAVSNLFGTEHRSEFLFRNEIKKLEWLIKLKIDPADLLKQPLKLLKHLPFLFNGIPRKKFRSDLKLTCKVSELPLIRSWEKDGGAFITLPQVISFPLKSFKPQLANIGMYRIQLNGNEYQLNEEIGLHYQLHRGIGIHHQQYLNSPEAFRISIAIGGPPAYTLASIFPLPEGLSEIIFSGFLNDRPYAYSIQDNFFIPHYVDFCITGTVVKNQIKPEGPFGDHLGYYSLTHPFPYLNNLKVYYKKKAIYPFTVVGRPPQEDSGFGHLIHQMVAELTPSEYPGLKQLNAVDAAGVHPLLLAVGSERYMPFRKRKPEELLTIANHLLGKGQTSLAKYLFIAAEEIDRPLNVNDIPDFFEYILERVDWNTDLHFYTQTTMDTLDYSGDNWNAGSKLVVACNRNKIRDLSFDLSVFHDIPKPYRKPKLIQKGIVLLQLDAFTNYETATNEIEILIKYLEQAKFNFFPLIVLCDNSDFGSAHYNNFLWLCFTRSNPSHDTYGVQSQFRFKHWSCKNNLIIDARKKPHHAPELEVDANTSQKVDEIISGIPALRNLFK